MDMTARMTHLGILLFFFAAGGGFGVKAQDIFEAARKGNVVQIEVLSKLRPNTVNAINEAGFTPLIIAVYRNQQKATHCLIKNGAEINSISSEGTALMAACFQGNEDLAAFLINQGADLNLTNEIGGTALMLATQTRNVAITRLLLKSGADKNKKDKGGRTALDFAKQYNSAELIGLLEGKPSDR
jgi:ankyrin repeat protein